VFTFPRVPARSTLERSVPPESSPLRDGPEAPEMEGLFAGPHLSDYWQVINRRLWLVLVIFTVTTASSIWAVSRQRVFFQASMSLQINDPLERQRPLVQGVRVSGMDIFVDPIESEIQVLRSSTIAATVADSLGMRLRRVSEDAVRSNLFRDAEVADEAPNGRYQLVYDASGSQATLRNAQGTVLGEAPVGSRLQADFVAFTPVAPPEEARVYDLEIVPRGQVVGELSFSATPRESTNIVDVSLVHPDPVLAPRALNTAGSALRADVQNPVRLGDDIEVMFDDNDGMAGIDEAVHEIEQLFNIRQMEADGGFFQQV